MPDYSVVQRFGYVVNNSFTVLALVCDRLVTQGRATLLLLERLGLFSLAQATAFVPLKHSHHSDVDLFT